MASTPIQEEPESTIGRKPEELVEDERERARAAQRTDPGGERADGREARGGARERDPRDPPGGRPPRE